MCVCRRLGQVQHKEQPGARRLPAWQGPGKDQTRYESIICSLILHLQEANFKNQTCDILVTHGKKQLGLPSLQKSRTNMKKILVDKSLWPIPDARAPWTVMCSIANKSSTSSSVCGVNGCKISNKDRSFCPPEFQE